MRREGYFLIDHQASPGTPQVPEGRIFEAATYTCPHCSRVVIKNPDRVRERAFCFKCNHHLCDQCGAAKECVPLMQQFDILERKILRG